MPKVGGKHYPYTQAGIAAANRARRGYNKGKRVTKAAGGITKPSKPQRPKSPWLKKKRTTVKGPHK